MVMNPESWNSYGLRISGPHGSGRTHLAHCWAEQCDAVFSTLPMTEVTVNIVLDDVTTTKNEASLFHLLNLVQAAGKRILLVCDKAPLTQHFKLPDLLSRLNALPQAQLHLPDDALMEMLLRKQIADRQLRVSDEVIHYLLPRIERSFKSLTQTVQQLDEQSLRTKKPVTIYMVKEILAVNNT